MVTTACENPELAIRWLDTFFMEDVIKTMWHKGFEGEDWAWEDGVKSMDGADRAVVKYNDAEEQNTFWNRDWIGSSWINRDLVYCVVATGDDLHQMSAGALYYQYGKDVGWPMMTWCDDMDLAAEKSQLQSLITDGITTALVEFIIDGAAIEGAETGSYYKVGIKLVADDVANVTASVMYYKVNDSAETTGNVHNDSLTQVDLSKVFAD